MPFLPARSSQRKIRVLHSLRGSACLFALAFGVACSSNTPGDDDDTTHATPKGGTGGMTGGAGRSAGGAAATGGSSGTGTAAGTGAGATGGGAGTGSQAGGSGGLGSAGMAGLPASGGMGAGGAGQGGVSGASALAGAAGTPPVGGSGGDAGAPGAGAGGSGGKATGFFMEDFESDTSGKQPTGWDNFISYQKNNPQNPSGMIEVLTDTTNVHGGTKAVHMHGDSNPAQLVRALPMGLTKLYVRAWVFMTRKLGQQTDNSANHESLIVLRRKSGSADDEVRFGEIKGVIGTNEVPTDNISPTMDKWHQATGPVVQPNTWTCIEVSFLADAMPNTLHATANGMSIHDITSIGTDQWQNGMMPSDWLAQKFAGNGGAAPEIVFGWQSFSSAANDVWMDDIVLSNDPIGCN